MSGDGENEPVRVPAAVFEGIDAVRRSGRVNMLNIAGVAEVARAMEWDDVADWILENRTVYVRGVFYGFASAAQRTQNG